MKRQRLGENTGGITQVTGTASDSLETVVTNYNHLE